MIEITIYVILALLFSAVLATLFRFWDFPTNTLKDFTVVAGVLTFVGALIAAFLAIWIKALDPTVPADFIIVTGFALGGMGAVRGLFEVTSRLVAPKKTK